MKDFDSDHWALILGGSSGFGLATANKLSRHKMNLAVVHRDRRGAMAQVQPAFDAMAARVGFRSWNCDALAAADRETVLAELKEAMGPRGKVRMLMHSIAFGNLKAFAPAPPPGPRPVDSLARALGVEPERVRAAVNGLFAEGEPAFWTLADPAGPGDENLLGDDDFTFTIHAMGTSLATWVQALLQRGMFAADARVLALTSEGNRLAWRGYAAVSAAKCALESVARTIARECAPFGIRANVIQAGVTNTPALRLIPGNRQILANAILRNPFGRGTTPEDVANVICLLCTDEAAWVNGDIIVVDGGEHLGA